MLPYMCTYVLECFEHNMWTVCQAQCVFLPSCSLLRVVIMFGTEQPVRTCCFVVPAENKRTATGDATVFIVSCLCSCAVFNAFSFQAPQYMKWNLTPVVLNKNCYSSMMSNVLFLPETCQGFTFKLNIKHSFLNKNATWFSPWLAHTGLLYVKQAVMKHVEGSGTLEVPRRLGEPA